ncbi:LysE family transporter [Cellulomonas humilata]|uniref:Threonine/homoserine/homoserine lactone efflux protein n=1 Tax=Cellulomonas humilata TaxID=144055 RepID=A0ABU0EK22_9CELL|nr:LysE family transporter [Cellulomonas humilata]MDQ0375633.1 threonine/homoserine/homoserine lactone efflux protein [Cellulomonas humilata]
MSPAFALGVLAGLSVAMPVGPVGVLLLRSGLVDGVRVAVAAACGIATVDVLYAVVAVAVGTPVSRAVGEHAALVRGVSAAVLVVIGVVGLVAATRQAAPDPGQDRTTTAVRSYGRFVALTAVNPLTAVTFTAIAVGLAALVGGAGSVVAFVVGVGLASLAWQLLLAVSSGLLGLRLPPVARTWVSVAGSVVVVAAGVALVV